MMKMNKSRGCVIGLFYKTTVEKVLNQLEVRYDEFAITILYQQKRISNTFIRSHFLKERIENGGT